VKIHWSLISFLVVSVLASSIISLQIELTPLVKSVKAANVYNGENQTGCTSIQLDSYAVNSMPVPSACVDGFCKLHLYTDAAMGMFGAGYTWEVYYIQNGTDNSWAGGPNITLGDYSFSDGNGTNGNGNPEGVFLGGDTSDGGYVRIMDDGAAENSADLWTIETQSSPSLTRAFLQVCPLTDCYYTTIVSDSFIPVPDFCIDDLCMITRYTDATFGAFGPGFTLPVYFKQNGTTNDWIGGPDINLGGIGFSQSGGTNGDGVKEYIFDGGVTNSGDGYARLYDGKFDSNSSDLYISFNAADELTHAVFEICPMNDCSLQTASQQYTNFNTPSFCKDALCTVVPWVDGTFGAFYPGFHWQVYYEQSSSNNAWFGGPSICFGGICYSDGVGVNGDTSSEILFEGGRTTPNEGYAVLRDDSLSAGETNANQWNIVLNKQDDLTSASYHICANDDCQTTIFLINKIFIPSVLR